MPPSDPHAGPGAGSSNRARAAEEECREGPIPFMALTEWEARFPWVVHGITMRGPSDAPYDLALFTDGVSGSVEARWEELRLATGAVCVLHSRQVHGREVRFHSPSPEGLRITPPGDGHVTKSPGNLLTVTVADCVPVLVVAERARAVAALHAGWRGVAAGVLERGLAVLSSEAGAAPAELHVHLGPAICGACYEVGPEVHAALGRPVPSGPEPVDLRQVAYERLVRSGVPESRVTSSTWCTRCGESPFFSHRGGDLARQLAFIGLQA